MRRVGAIVAGVATALVLLGTSGPRAQAQESPPHAGVAFVGDSIGRDAEPEITDEVTPTNPIAYYHAIAAGYTAYHLPLLLPVVQAPDGPDIVVAELGTGDAFWSHSPAQFEADMRAFLDAVIPSVQCVLWVDQKPGGNRAYPMINDRAEAFNAVVHRVAGEYDSPDVHVRAVHYAAWTELAGAPSPYFLADWLHLTSAGERELARLVGTAVEGCDPDLTTGPFWDVQDDFWAADDIAWAAEQGLVSGYENHTYGAVVGRFRPLVTRGQALEATWRLAGSPPEPQRHPWSDGRPWLRPALRWAGATGAMPGWPDGTFRPGDPVTRGALVRTLWRVAGSPTGYGPVPWTDVPSRLDAALRWAAATGVVSGFGDGTFRPAGTVDRAELAVLLHHAADLPVPEPAPPTTVPAPTTVPPATTLPPVTTVPLPTTVAGPVG